MARVLGSVDTTKDNGATAAVKGADIETEGATVDKTLLDHAVNHKRIGRIPTIQTRTGTHDIHASERGVIGDTTDLASDSGRYVDIASLIVSSSGPE